MELPGSPGPIQSGLSDSWTSSPSAMGLSLSIGACECEVGGEISAVPCGTGFECVG